MLLSQTTSPVHANSTYDHDSQAYYCVRSIKVRTSSASVAIKYWTMQMLQGVLRQGARRPLSASQLLSLSKTHYSTQFEESMRVPKPSTTQTVESPPITPDSSTGKGDHVSDGRSSQTTSAYVAEEPIKKLVHKVLSIYETRSLEEQRRLLSDLYDKDAIYENNATLLRGREEIIRRFALLPISTHSVKLEYEKPVVLGATTSAPEALNDLAYKGELQVEVKNTQQYNFDRGHSLWRTLLLPHGDLQLSVLTRLTLSGDHKVLYHRDIWTQHHTEWWAPLQRCWGMLEQAAGSRAASKESGKSA